MRSMALPGMEYVVRDLSKSQWYTPPWLAERVWKWWLDKHSPLGDGLRVIEPSAGIGSFVRPALHSGRCARIHAIELDPRNVALLRMFKDPRGVLVVDERDFLAGGPIGEYNVALMNPPYEDGQDVEHILRALAWAPYAVGVFRSAMVHGAERYEQLWRHVDIIEGRWLKNRPSFGTTNDGAKSDFVVLEMCRRERLREVDEVMQLKMGWW